jgi:hypothetical protein
VKKAAAVLVAIGAMGAIPAFAQAAPITECGNRYFLDGATNITTRDVTCPDARSFVDKYSNLWHRRSGWVTLSGWHAYLVRFTYEGHAIDDIRATRPGTDHVIHFQMGPYGVSGGWYTSGKCPYDPPGQPCY